MNYCLFVTARQRRLGQGNVFTPVCHSVHRGGGLHPGGLHLGGCLLLGGCLHLGGGLHPGVPHPGGRVGRPPPTETIFKNDLEK